MNQTNAELTDGRDPGRLAGELTAPQVEDLLRVLGSTIRSYRLYSGNGPMLARFVEALRDRIRSVCSLTDALRLEIREQSILWGEEVVYPSGDATAELAFSFYKDGIREITLLPGFEHEVERLLSVLGRVPQLSEDDDDLITLLWEENFVSFRYQYVELASEGLEIGTPSGVPPAPVDAQAVREAAQAPAASPGVRPDDFHETLHFLDEAELRQLAEEVKREAARDLWGDVLSALLDRLEDGTEARQLRVVRILEEALPSMLGSGAFDRAANLLRSLAELAARQDRLAPPVMRRVREVFEQLSRPETLQQLVQVLEVAPESIRNEGLEELFRFFPPGALAPLMRAMEEVTRPDVRRLLERATLRLAESSREEVLRLLSDPDPAVAAGAARWVASLGFGAATNDLVRLLRQGTPAVRVAAVEALASLRAAVAGGALVSLLDDPEREVRIAAARALESLEFSSARRALEAAVHSKRLRTADRSEKIAFFEAYGRVGGAEAVAALTKALSGKSWLGRGETPEIRACAALGLARVRHPSARAALNAAADDADPVVRSAVIRALRGDDA